MNFQIYWLNWKIFFPSAPHMLYIYSNPAPVYTTVLFAVKLKQTPAATQFTLTTWTRRVCPCSTPHSTPTPPPAAVVHLLVYL